MRRPHHHWRGRTGVARVSLGHNGKIAFGITIFAMDQEDLYVYELNPRNPSQYRYKGKWESMTEVSETIDVKGGAKEERKLNYTRHGPVLKIDRENNRAFAMRTVWNEPRRRRLFRIIASAAREIVGRVQGREQRLGRTAAQPRLRRRQRRHRLGRIRPYASTQELGRPHACSGRRPL